MTKDNRGFTLVELMIVVAIMGILAALAIPNFMAMLVRSKQAEAGTNLNAIYTAQTSYFADKNTYADGTDAFELIGWYPESRLQSRYTYIMGDAIMRGNTPIAYTPAGVAATEISFFVIAASNLDNDATLDIQTIDDTKALCHPLNDDWN